MIIDEIRSFLGSYFDVLQNQDLDLFDNVFHKDAVLYSQQDGKTIVRPYAEYRRIVEGRQAPEAVGAPRYDEILLIDVLSDDMAMAKVRLRLFDNVMVDHLNLMKVDGHWMVFAKHFHRAA